MKLVHQISKLITIQESGVGVHKLSLYYTDNFICSISFACHENDVEKFRAEYIETLLKHIADPINKYFEPVQA